MTGLGNSIRSRMTALLESHRVSPDNDHGVYHKRGEEGGGILEGVLEGGITALLGTQGIT